MKVATLPGMLHAPGTREDREHPRNVREGDWVRVLLNEDGKIKTDDSITDGSSRAILLNRTNLVYALKAPNGRKVPINGFELATWLGRYYHERKSRSGHTAAYLLDGRPRIPWPGCRVDYVPLHRGAWWIVASDDDRVLIPETQTAPLAMLRFNLSGNGTVVAHNPAVTMQDPPEEVNPSAGSNANQDCGRGSKNSSIN